MDWDKAKNYVIIFLLLLNLFLLCFITYKRSTQTVGKHRVEDLSALAERYNISISCVLPSKYPPMPKVSVGEYSYDALSLEKLFFNSLTGISRTDKEGKGIFTNGTGILSLGGEGFTFKDDTAGKFTEEEALKKAGSYIKSINKLFGSFTYHDMARQEDRLIITYYDRAGNYSIFSNRVVFTFYKKGGFEIEESYTPVTAGKEKQNIIASDEAVYSALNTISEDYPEGCKVQGVEAGYYIFEEGKAGAYYMISTDKKVYFLDALSGSIKS